jgi:hypothetical protein
MLVLMFIAAIFHLGFFACILLVIGSFLLLNYRGRIKFFLSNVADKFKRKKVYKGVKSSYERMSIEE